MATAADLVTPEGHWVFIPAPGGEVVLVEHWPHRPGKRRGWARGSSLSRPAARALFKRLRERAL
jgi:hypothetical protein